MSALEPADPRQPLGVLEFFDCFFDSRWAQASFCTHLLDGDVFVFLDQSGYFLVTFWSLFGHFDVVFE